ncbi:hypothetical protein [Biostraticola tofi]|uniref:Uncharacterized protein n=1 Tax=Biostraticola tofi TaxID=466109 RepID=A0A4V2W5H3_9GAMM|nr:hypothetical protein [Biostraticola tofi]TCV99805.1 hypothetical protein EDC52_101142 [Biostraticola tofi]
MIPSIPTLKNFLTPFFRGDDQTATLTIDRITNETVPVYDNQCIYRYLGHLSWVENDAFASLNAKVDFINKTVAVIMEKIPWRDMRITFISLGSAGLLTEFYIHDQLRKFGYNNLHWRAIDIDYQNNTFDNCRKEFSHKVNEQFRAFTTEQTYLKKSMGGYFLAQNDRDLGATIVLSIIPPTALPKTASKADDVSGCMFIRGRPVKDPIKANGIYLLVTSNKFASLPHQVLKALESGEQLVAIDFMMKVSLNRGGYTVTLSPSEMGEIIKRDTKPYLDFLNRTSAATQQKITLLNIDKALDVYLQHLPGSNKCGEKFFVSDYDVSVDNLRDYFSNGANISLFASFDKNEHLFSNL